MFSCKQKVVFAVISLIAILFGVFPIFKISENVASSVIGYLSIASGFTVTSLAVLANSNYMKKLHQRFDDPTCLRESQKILRLIWLMVIWALFTVALMMVILGCYDHIKTNNVLIGIANSTTILCVGVSSFLLLMVIKVLIYNALSSAGEK